MAKEKEGKEEPKREREAEKKDGEKSEGKGKKKKHLHEIRSTQAEDGSIVHHHTYKEHKDAKFSEPERGPVATSASPEEAGQHVTEQFGMNQGGGGGQEPEPEGGGAAPAGGMAQA
jgi:hypothetical protein